MLKGKAWLRGGYTRQWQVSASGGTAPNTENYKTVRVRVTWNDRGATNQLTMTTVKSWAN